MVRPQLHSRVAGMWSALFICTILRWCVSYVWSAATVLLHRLMTSQLTLITASSKPALPGRAPPRPASSGHIHPEPLVCCQLLHEPPAPEQDVIFVHGLYGSLENTWRQGDWRSKYKLEPNKVPLKRSASIPSPCVCHECHNDKTSNTQANYENSWKDVTYTKTEFYDKGMEKVIGNDDLLMTEQFYSNTLLNQVKIVDNFEMQAQFVRELFECENMNEMYNQSSKEERSTESSAKENFYQCECNECRDENEKLCATGCGCVCDRCYSPCWPRDWLRVDFPNARVISINYTSDPYLWRPLWVKESKRLRLHERAEQMTRQLLDLGVGERPIVWVGHSKGGLFIKQIYCEAYEAFLKTQKGEKDNQNETNEDNNNETQNSSEKLPNQNGAQDGGNIPNLENNRQHSEPNINPKGDFPNVENGKQHSETSSNQNIAQENGDNIINLENNKQPTETNINQDDGDIPNLKYDKQHSETNRNQNQNGTREDENNIPNLENIKHNSETSRDQNQNDGHRSENITDEDEMYNFKDRSSLWSKSTGFMFYSVPHRGSALADIKTPITARSIELLEISKDNTLVLSLQERWLRATEPSKPVVRSLVETNRTLMAVLWLRIVSVESADAGIGALCGISVDHREICKPSSRSCILYKELLNLIHAALDRWRWNTL